VAAEWGSFWVVVVLVFAAVFLLAREVIVPLLDGSARWRQGVEKRVRELTTPQGTEASLLRDRYLLQLKPWEQAIETRPVMARIRKLHTQAGLQRPGYRTILLAAGAALAGVALVYAVVGTLVVALPVGLLAAPLPFVRLNQMKQKRVARFEGQLPEVVDVMVRALRAGYPFSEALRTVATEMESPAREEFALTFNDINYGGDVRGALVRLVERAPGGTLRALVTAVLVQRETGGNLAEVLEKIAAVLRSRFRFERRVRTLSAEGRITAWVLSLTPAALLAIISVVNPQYMPMLTNSPLGPRLIAGAVALMIVGIFWIRRILRIEV
jgi:tight adherence protein B